MAVAPYAVRSASMTYTWSSRRPRTLRTPCAEACHIPSSFDHISAMIRSSDFSANARTSSRPNATAASRTAAIIIPFHEAKIVGRSEEHTSELQSQSNLVCRLLLEKKKVEKLRNLIQ